jgi:hypothetical protein
MPVTDADIDLYYPGAGGKSDHSRRYWENYLLKLLRADIAAGGGTTTSGSILAAALAALSSAASEVEEPIFVPGIKGADGATGAQGPMGPALYFLAEDGVDGDRGPPGATGAQGPAGGGGSFTFTTVEVDLGSTPRGAGTFTIAGAFTPAKPVLITQAAAAYTGKGTLEDEAEMDPITATGFTADAATIRAYWQASHGPVAGNVKFNYAVST